ncbi:MAG TPA: class I SAM-dependent methyltransferase [Tepidisphaeraceae bacterium]|jgi:tRNA (cmo5U34)-methyltransferase
MEKSTVEEIRRRFDGDVERFSNLETGQSATMDAPLVLDLIAQCAAAVNPGATALLDIGCGAGNYTLRLMQHLKLRQVTLIDLSQPMLEKAKQRINAVDPAIEVRILQADLRQVDLGEETYDLAVAAAVLHHLRTDEEWLDVFENIHASLKVRGTFWVSDLVAHQVPGVHKIIWQRYAAYLKQLKGEQYQKDVFEYIEKEDTPHTLMFQLETLKRAGFTRAEVLHANVCFGAYVGVKDAKI